MRHRTRFILVVALQVAVLLVMIGMKWSTLAWGEKILLQTAPVDPWDFFRGDYVILNYEISRLDLSNIPADKQEYRNNETIYVTLGQKGKYWHATAVASRRPEKGLAIKGVVRSAYQEGPTGSYMVEVDYGINSYYVPQHEGKWIEGQRSTLDAQVSVDRWGNAALAKLIIDGQEVEFK